MSFTDVITKVRKVTGKTYAALAEEAGVSPYYMHRLGTGVVLFPRWDVGERIIKMAARVLALDEEVVRRRAMSENTLQSTLLTLRKESIRK